MKKAAIIKTLSGFKPPAPYVIVDQQTVPDIMEGMADKHFECLKYYQSIAPTFRGGDIYSISERIWDFCKDNFVYHIEGLNYQYVSTPMEQLRRGHNDCKGYSLFAAGIIDALRRCGEPVEWCFRFVSYKLFKPTPYHVFVVVNPKTDNIWIDPVMTSFNLHWPYMYRVDRYVPTPSSDSCTAQISGIEVDPDGYLNETVGSAEDDLLTAVKEYADGIASAIQLTQTSGTLNAISAGVLKTASTAVPGLSQALALINAGGVVLSSAFGPGSLAARLYADLGKNILLMPVALINDIFNGRTYNTDQYWAAQYYQFYVLGNSSVTGINQIKDSDIIPALKWFIDRLNVFVSGREHIIALTKSPQAYMNYYSANPDTTMDLQRVQLASQVAQQFFVFNNVAGSWRNTIGVFDPALVQLALQTGQSVEQVNREVQQGQIQNPVSSGSNTPLLLMAAAAAVLILTSD